MSVSDQDIFLIESYLDNSLSAKDLENFNERLTDDDFVSELEIHKNLISKLKTSKEIEFKSEMNEMLKKSRIDYGHAKRMTLFKILSAAAALVLLLFIASKFFNTNGQIIEENKAFAEYFIPFPGQAQQRGNEKLDELKINAFNAYNTKSYVEAENYFNDLILKSPEDIRLKLFLANCYIINDKSSKAVQLLQKERSQEDEILNHHMDWYLIMALIETKDSNSAIARLDTILKDENHTYFEQSSKLKEILE